MNNFRYPLRSSTIIICAFVFVSLLSSCADIGDPVKSVPVEGNVAPVLRHVGERYASVNNVFQLLVSASDSESTPSLTALNLPPGAVFVDSGNGRGLFSWTPMPIQANSVIAVTFVATDDSLASDMEIVPLNVIDYTFDNFIAPEITVFCTNSGCHGTGSVSSNFSVLNFSSFKLGGANGLGIVPGDTLESIVFQKLGSTPPFGSPMPLGGGIPITDFLAASTLDSIARWILAGAPES